MPPIMKPVRLPRDPLSLQAPSPTFIDSQGDWHELELEQAVHVTLVVDTAVEVEGGAVVGEASVVDDAFGATHVTCMLKPAAGPNGVVQVPDGPSWSGVPGAPLQLGEL